MEKDAQMTLKGKIEILEDQVSDLRQQVATLNSLMRQVGYDPDGLPQASAR